MLAAPRDSLTSPCLSMSQKTLLASSRGDAVDLDEGVAELMGYTEAGGAGAVDHEPLVCECGFGDADGGHDGGEGDGTCTLAGHARTKSLISKRDG